MARPRLVYDDDCGFCTWCATLAARRGDVEPVGFSEATPDQRARLPEDWESCVHLLTDDEVYSCGAAVERALCEGSRALAVAFAALRRVPGYERARERLYRFGAEHRDWWGRFASAEPPAE